MTDHLRYDYLFVPIDTNAPGSLMHFAAESVSKVAYIASAPNWHGVAEHGKQEQHQDQRKYVHVDCEPADPSYCIS